MSVFIVNLKAGIYNKFLVALLGAILSIVVQFYGDNSTVQIVVSLLTALGVFHMPNKQAV